MQQQIYLDHNSTTPIDPRVADTMLEYYQTGYANPASQHRMGQSARTRLEQLRSEVIDLLGGNSQGLDAEEPKAITWHCPD